MKTTNTQILYILKSIDQEVQNIKEILRVEGKKYTCSQVSDLEKTLNEMFICVEKENDNTRDERNIQ